MASGQPAVISRSKHINKSSPGRDRQIVSLFRMGNPSPSLTPGKLLPPPNRAAHPILNYFNFSPIGNT